MPAMDLTYKTLDTQIMPAPESRRMTFTISTGSVDRDKDTLDPKGWQLDNYRKNPTVLFAHDYKALPVAKCVEIKNTDSALIATAEFLPEGKYPFADTVYDMLKAGFLNATSVGFRAIEYEQNTERKGFDYRKQELMEFSVVPIPSNPEALVSQRSATTDQVKSWTKAIIDWADEQQASKAQCRVALLLHNAMPASGLIPWKANAKAWDDFERDYNIEAEIVDLPASRVAKLLTMHGFAEESAIIDKKDGTSGPESQDGRQAAQLRLVHHAAMDAYANAHHADTVMTSMATMEANMPTDGKSWDAWKAMTGKQKESMTQAHDAVKRAKDHAMEAATQCASMGGKAFADQITKPLPTPNSGESQDDFISRCAGNPTMNTDYPDNPQRLAVCHSQWRRHQRETDIQVKQEDHELWLELEDEDPDLLEIDERTMTEAIGKLVAEEAGAQVRAALNAALGRLD